MMMVTMSMINRTSMIHAMVPVMTAAAIAMSMMLEMQHFLR
jgi:hypothetical protein